MGGLRALTNYQLLDAKPRPRGLFQDLSDELVAELAPLFPSYKRVAGGDAVHDDEFDVLVTATQPWGRSRHLHIVAFGLIPQRTPLTETNDLYEFTLKKRTLATEMSIEPSLDTDLKELIQRDLYPIFHDQEEKRAVQLEFAVVFGGGTPKQPTKSMITPFITAGGNSILSGSFTQKPERNGSHGGRVWFLPTEVAHPARWVALALRDFSTFDPERVPTPPDWWSGGKWNTQEQSDKRENVQSLEALRANQIADIDSQLQKAREAVAEADAKAHAGILRLLTQDGDSLSSAVEEVLLSLGFEVTNMDMVHAEGDRREDLRVTDPNLPNWLALVEVKGYTNGAKVTDLAKLERHTSRFARDNQGRLPDAKWHVVNAFKGIAPDLRPIAIPNDDELIEFAESGGMLIDTRDLFHAARQVESGQITIDSVRASLIERPMRWQAPNIQEG